jgi:CHAD domain-containing protein
MAEAMRTTLEPWARTLKKRLRKARHGDADGVHDSRTLLRRLRQGLAIMGSSVFDPEVVDDLRRGLRRVEQALGPTRDDDVMIAHLHRYLRRAGAGTRRSIAPLRQRLHARRSRHERALSRELRRERTRRRTARVRRWLERGPRDVLPESNKADTAARRLVRHFTFDQTLRAYEEVIAYELRWPPDLDVIHKVRSSARRLRFTLEVFRPALSPEADEIIDSVRSLQDRLGALHDHAMAARLLERWIAAGKIPGNAAVLAYAAKRERERDKLRAEFDHEWRVLDSDRFRAALFRALGGDRKGAPARAPLHLVPAARSA